LEQQEKSFKVEGTDRESLLYNFLEEFIYLLDAEDFLTFSIKSINVDEDEGSIRCTVIGDKADNYKFTNDVKAITYSEMFVREKDGLFECQVVLDV